MCIMIYVIMNCTSCGQVHELPLSHNHNWVGILMITITEKAHCFHDCRYISPILLLWDLSTLFVTAHLWPFIQTYIYIYINIYTYIYVCMYVCICVYIYIYIYIYIYMKKTKYEIFLQRNTKLFLQKVLFLLHLGSCKNYELCESCRGNSIETL